MAVPNVGVGWHGYLLVGTSTTILPYMSEDITEKNTHIPAEDVHGGGSGTTPQTTGPFYSELNAADGPLTYDGSINAHVYAGNGNFGDATFTLFQKAIDGTERLDGFGTADPLIVSPGGAGLGALNAFAYPASASTQSTDRCVVQTLNVNGSAGNLIDFDVSVVSTTRETTTDAPAASDLEFEQTGDNVGTTNPVAWHAVDIDVVGSGEDFDSGNKVTEFSISVDNNTIPLDTFNRARTRRDIYQGIMVCTGSITYYAPSGTFATLNRVFGGVTPGITIDLGVLNAGTTAPASPGIISLDLQTIVADPAPIPGPGPNEVVFREFSFRALAATALPSITLSRS